MDRSLPRAIIRASRLRRVAGVALLLIAIGAILVLLPGWIRPTLQRARIRTAVVETGSIDAVITATGTVVPEVERVLSSPVDARLLRVMRRPGAAVKAGEPVAELDLAESQLAIERITTNLGITDNQQAQALLALEKSLADIDARIEGKTLHVQVLEEKAAASRRLAEEGLVSQQMVREHALEVQQASIELAQLRRERGTAELSTRLQADGLALQRAALDKEAAAARHTLELATTHADRDGILTWILSREGALVRRGEVIARIADLSSFRVDASASDVHSSRIRPGIPVRVIINDTPLDGAIAEVLPNVENDVVLFTVALRQGSHPLLRPQMRVEVFVITDRRARTDKVRLGPFADAADRANVFVLRSGRAVRTAVRFGLRSFDEIEVVSGLATGDEVVISDVRDYLHLEELEVE